MDERTLLRIKNRIIEGKVSYRPGTSDIDVYLGLAGETGFPHQGTVNFVNNKVDAQTGTITVRGSLANPRKLKKDGQVVADKDKGAYLMTPGMFCRVRVPTSRPYKALLVAERAFVIDQGLKNIFVLDGEDKVQYRQVTLGALQPDGTRVVLDGVKEDDRILITGLQQVRAGMKVERGGKAHADSARADTAGEVRHPGRRQAGETRGQVVGSCDNPLSLLLLGEGVWGGDIDLSFRSHGAFESRRPK